MTFELPPALKLAESLCVQMEQAVSRFSRYHKYTIGTKLREAAMAVAEIAHLAWRERVRQSVWTRRLVAAVDTLKLRMQIGKQLRAFASFGQFEALMRSAVDLGRQAGGWHKQQQARKHLKGQNGRPVVDGQRPQILSTSAASTGAKP